MGTSTEAAASARSAPAEGLLFIAARRLARFKAPPVLAWPGGPTRPQSHNARTAKFAPRHSVEFVTEASNRQPCGVAPYRDASRNGNAQAAIDKPQGWLGGIWRVGGGELGLGDRAASFEAAPSQVEGQPGSDPVELPELLFEPVIDYELVLVVHEEHRLAGRVWTTPQDLIDEVLITVSVSVERLDAYTRFLVPGRCRPREHWTAETTDLMLQLVAAGRGVSVLPDWLVREDGAGLPIRTLSLGEGGIDKSINLGLRRGEEGIAHIAGFLTLAGRAGVTT
ncbi:MAG TPA: LysR substrate-binding domain-containing protein [Microvirga sp.]|jgi:hypothetical protein